MSTPHDYYKHGPEFPELHNRHEGIPYVDPDYFANHHDDQLPILSTIGRGARGESVTAQRDSEGNLLILNENNEVLCQFALGDWDISVVPNPTHNIQEGQNSYFDVIINNGVEKKSERVVVPCGEQGSRIFLYNDGNLPAKNNQVYQILKSSLKPSERSEKKSYNPDPRVNDIIFAESRSGEENDLVIGYITRSYDDYVVMVESMRFPIEVKYEYHYGEVKAVFLKTDIQIGQAIGGQQKYYTCSPSNAMFVTHVDNLDEFCPLAVSFSWTDQVSPFNNDFSYGGYNLVGYKSGQNVPELLQNIATISSEYWGYGFFYKPIQDGGYDIYLAQSSTYIQTNFFDIQEAVQSCVDGVTGNVSKTVLYGAYTLREHQEEEPPFSSPGLFYDSGDPLGWLEPVDITNFVVTGTDDAAPIFAATFDTVEAYGDEWWVAPRDLEVLSGNLESGRLTLYIFFADEGYSLMSNKLMGEVEVSYDESLPFLIVPYQEINSGMQLYIKFVSPTVNPGEQITVPGYETEITVSIGNKSCSFNMIVPEHTYSHYM